MYLSKSTFIRGFDCPIRIRHAVDWLASRKEEDDFLRMLAEGGFQFERLVRQAWPGAEIRGDIRDPQAAHAETMTEIRRLMAAGEGVLHEGTFFHSGCSARVDMIRVGDGYIELCEIKAKSFDGPADPVLGRQVVLAGDRVIGKQGVRSTWLRYVADVGFQAWVAERALAAEGLGALQVRPRLIVVNKNAICGEFDSFQNIVIDAAHGVAAKRMTSADLRWVKEPPEVYRSSLIVEVDVSDAVDMLRKRNAKSKSRHWRDAPLDTIAEEAASIVAGSLQVDPADERGFNCRDCEFRASDDRRPESGFSRCWGDAAPQVEQLVTLYYGASYKPSSGPAAIVVGNGAGKYVGPDWVALTIASVLLESARIASLAPDSHDGTRAKTRNMQIVAERSGSVQLAPEFHDEVHHSMMCGGKASRLHFLDFETTMACLPLANGMRPYEVVAFQFSCHSGSFDGVSTQLSDVRHVSFLNTAESAPSSVRDDDRAFADELRKCLGDDASPVFHWAVHERTILKKIRTRLFDAPDSGKHVNDPARIAFLDTMVGPDGKTGRLVDMRTVAEGSIMAPGQGGRYSMKQLLPAICREQGIRDLVWSLMGTDLVGSAAATTKDPYKLLPPMPGAIDGGSDADGTEDEEGFGADGDGVRCGTDAMRAFQQLRFESVAKWSAVDRQALIAAMERYCKLDTAAMVAVWTWMVGKAETD